MVAMWAESIQIQVGLIKGSQVRISLEDVYMVKILNKKELWTHYKHLWTVIWPFLSGCQIIKVCEL